MTYSVRFDPSILSIWKPCGTRQSCYIADGAAGGGRGDGDGGDGGSGGSGSKPYGGGGTEGGGCGFVAGVSVTGALLSESGGRSAGERTCARAPA